MSRLLAMLGSLALLLTVALRPAAAAEVWLEAENFTANNMELRGAGWGNKQYLSGEQWVNVALDAKTGKIPEGGIILSYDFQAPQAGQYTFWHRIGYEHERSDYQFRINGGAWQTASRKATTTDVMEIVLWCEVAWVNLGQVPLQAGKNTLEFKLEMPQDLKVQTRLLHASDAMFFTTEPFFPNGPHQPGAKWQTEQDTKAVDSLFTMQAPTDPAQAVVLPLKGLWQIARSDEQLIDDRTGPIKAIPAAAELHWKGINVPGDKNVARLDLMHGHRLFYRTRINVPAEAAGRAFVLELPSYSMLATVFVNGQQVAFGNTPYTPLICDLTKVIKPGQVNELVIGIKDNYYGLTGDTRHFWNYPLEVFKSNQGVTVRLDFPVAGTNDSGLLLTPRLVARGLVYTADVFAKPNVKDKQLGLEVTVHNPAATAATVTVKNVIVPLAGGPAEKTFAEQKVELPAGVSKTLNLNEGWEKPRLWWPDDPQLYQVVTTIERDGKVIDTQQTKFGFRQWGWASDQFTLNGIPWHGFADTTYSDGAKDAEKMLAHWRKSGQNMWRFWGHTWGGMSAEEALDFMDRRGVVVRRSGHFNGELASYSMQMVVGQDIGQPKYGLNKPLFDNVERMTLNQLKAERNHPSILIWSIENEITFINARLTGTSHIVEPRLTTIANACMKLDPTRPVMVDGGNALLDESLPVNGGHYLERAQREYPDAAYDWTWANGPEGEQWKLPANKPIFLGEQFFANGYDPSWFAGIGGEKCFLGRGEAQDSVYLYARMLSEGYRWTGTAALHFWFIAYGENLAYHKVWQPVVVLSRQWNWTFASGSEVPRKLKLINDTRYADPIDVLVELRISDRQVQSEKRTLQPAPGTGVEFDVTLKVPQVKERTSGQVVLIAQRGGKEIWRDEKKIAIITPGTAAKPKIAAAELAVLDPQGQATARLKARGIAFTAIDDPAKLPATAKVLLVGAKALTSQQATDPMWIDLATRGVRVVVLEQEQPLRYQALPADLGMTATNGRIAFLENPSHPIFQGLAQEDFFCWSGDHIAWRKAYLKASRGAISLVQCDESLRASAMAMCPVDRGFVLLSQLVIGEKLATDPVAQVLFDNLVNYAAEYQLVQKAAVAAVAEGSLEAKLLAESGLKFDTAGDALAALSTGKHQIAIVQATPANLRKLVENKDKVESFAKGGGWLMLWGVTPEGLSDFNKVVGVEHLIRPFERERVTLASVRDPLTAGLTSRDVTLQTGTKIFGWRGDRWGVDDAFSHVVDLEDIAPFCTISGAKASRTPPGTITARNLVNGFHSADAWMYIFYFERKDGEKYGGMTMELPREEEITRVALMLNEHYRKISKLEVYIDEDPTPVVLSPEPTGDRQEFALNRKAKKTVRFQIAGVDDSSDKAITGLDNVWVYVKRSEEFKKQVVPLLNIGGLVKYPMGQGGVMLNQVQVLANEEAPENFGKKATIVGQILRNLGATFVNTDKGTGEHYSWTPVKLDAQYNQYITKDRGWYADEKDLAALPAGEVKLGGVTFAVNDFKTSPVPSCFMLAGNGATGKMPQELALKTSVKTESLAFLHTARLDKEWKPREAKDQPPVVFKYVITYEDGKTETVPVQLHHGVGSWLTKEPAGLKDAALAWAGKFDDGTFATLYTLKWTNPRPEATITEIKLMYEGNGGTYAVPALLGVSAGRK